MCNGDEISTGDDTISYVYRGDAGDSEGDGSCIYDNDDSCNGGEGDVPTCNTDDGNFLGGGGVCDGSGGVCDGADGVCDVGGGVCDVGGDVCDVGGGVCDVDGGVCEFSVSDRDDGCNDNVGGGGFINDDARSDCSSTSSF